MNTSTNYNFNLPEGTDLVNLLTQLIPNWSSLDTILRNIQNDTFENSTELVSLGVHAISRTDPNAKLLKWVATANFTAGETFTVDGNVVAASTPAGATLATGAYVTGVTVLAALNSDESAMTIFVSGTNVATDSERLGGELPAYYAKDSDMETVQQDITDIDNLLGSTSISAIGDGTVTGAISSINTDLTELGTVNLLGTATSGNSTITLNDSVSNYKWIYVIYNAQNTYFNPSSIFPLSVFKTIPNLVVNYYSGGGQTYSVFSYVDDTHVYFSDLHAASSGIGVNIYGIK